MRYKVGRYTTGITFIAIGFLVLLHQLTDTNWLGSALKFWPLVIIGYGLEYLIATRKPERTRFDFGGAFFIAFMLIVVAVYSFFGGFIFNFTEMKYSISADPIQYAGNEVEGLDVDGLFGTITVEAIQDQKVTIVPTYRSNRTQSLNQMIEEVGLQTSLQSGTLVVKGHKLLGRNKGMTIFGIPQSGVDLHIYAPPEIATKISNDFGGIEIRGMENLRSVEQNFGDIKIYDSKGKLKVNSDFGAVNLRNYTGDLNIKSSFGEVKVDGQVLGDWNIQNDFGSVKLSLSVYSSFKYQFNVDLGSKDLPEPFINDKHSGTINSGEHQLRVDLSFGSLEVDLK